MKIGVIADTHDRVEAIESAVDLLNAEDIGHVLHAGDIVSPFAIIPFKDLKAELHIVWGNNDGDRLLLAQRISSINAKLYGNFAEIKIEGRIIAMTHGAEEAIVKALTGCGYYDLVITGHTHKPEVTRESKTLLVNPGPLSGYLAKDKTFAIVDLEKMLAEIRFL
jgi:putative phosphoesterase